jgi:hypothetical protein
MEMSSQHMEGTNVLVLPPFKVRGDGDGDGVIVLKRNTSVWL